MTRHGQLYRSDNVPPRSLYYDRGRFGRLFPSLPPFAVDRPLVRNDLLELGEPGGIMDANDQPPPANPLAPNPNNRDNPDQTAGVTFLGQFLDHDMTFDPTSNLERQVDPEAVNNFRVPALELDSLYGSGRAASPHLYDQSSPGGIKLLVDSAAPNDLPRNSQNTALIGDPRNDENLVVSQFHRAVLGFHNKVIADLKLDLGAGYTSGEVFAEAQRVVRWHYQWLVIHDFLVSTVGNELVDDVLSKGPRHFKWRNDPYIPVEFSVGAYRFGHSQVRPSYRANFGTSATDPAQQFFAMIFDPAATDGNDPADLRGARRAPRRFIDWQTFFDFSDGRVRRNKKLDTTLSTPLFDLMGQPPGDPVSLATRNLLRNLTMKVPSGQRVAKAMKLPVLAASDLDDLKPFELSERTPLWFYVLREAEVTADGEQLGPVGGRIVAEVIIGLIKGDRQSYLRQEPDWTPTYGADESFMTVDLLNAADVV